MLGNTATDLLFSNLTDLVNDLNMPASVRKVVITMMISYLKDTLHH